MSYEKKRIDGDELLMFCSRHGEAQEIRPMFRTLKSNSPFSAPRDDTAHERAAETEGKANSCYPRFQTRVCFRWCVNAFASLRPSGASTFQFCTAVSFPRAYEWPCQD
jgi:hypothetical protein